MKSQKWIIGIDEVGRGPIAGPVAVCACAVRLIDYKKSKWSGLTDSKKMTILGRNLWYQKALNLEKSKVIKFSVVYKSNKFIDKNGISKSIKDCISLALKNLELKPSNCLVLLDGSLKAPAEYLNQKTIIKGDQKEKIISMASVIAKVCRDKKMDIYHLKQPFYYWNTNKGYGTKAHYGAIKKEGITELHRRTYLTKL